MIDLFKKTSSELNKDTKDLCMLVECTPIKNCAYITAFGYNWFRVENENTKEIVFVPCTQLRGQLDNDFNKTACCYRAIELNELFFFIDIDVAQAGLPPSSVMQIPTTDLLEIKRILEDGLLSDSNPHSYTFADTKFDEWQSRGQF